jgi:hypothetical protein
MEKKELEQFLDQERWLLNNGLLTDSVKNQLFFCGSIVHTDVQAVELDIHPEKKVVEYTIYVDKQLLNKIEIYKKLSTATSLYGMWKFKRFLKKNGALDLPQILNKFVTDYCGPKWVANVTVADFDVYVDNIGDKSENDGSSQSADKRPD